MNADLDTLKERLKADMDALKEAVGALAGGALGGELAELDGEVEAALASNDPDVIYKIWKRVRKLLKKAKDLKGEQDYEEDKTVMKRLRDSARPADAVDSPEASQSRGMRP